MDSTKWQWVGVFFLSIGTLPSALAAPATTTEDVSISADSPPLSAAHAKRLSNLTLHALKRVDDAETALGAGKPDAARSDLKKASDVIESVRSEIPTVVIRDSIWKASKKIESGKTVDISSDLMPISDQLDVMEDFVPAKEAKAHVAKAKDATKTGKNSVASAELRDAMNVLDNNEVDVRLDKLQHAIDTAITKIDDKKPKEALAELKAASFLEDFDTVMLSMPTQKKAAH